MQQRASHPLIAIVGPTATGKSSLALQLAQRFDGEIVNGDSRLVYRHMDIGSAKPSPQDLNLAPHHLVNIVNPDEPYSLALYLAQANEAIQDIQNGAKRPCWPAAPGSTSAHCWRASTPRRYRPTQR